jgi:hypothetical protein
MDTGFDWQGNTAAPPEQLKLAILQESGYIGGPRS